MASITKEMALPYDAATAWAALRDPAQAHRAFAGVLTGCTVDGDTRTVTFANGMVVRERIVDIDDDRRRIAYWIADAPFAHHNASMEVRDDGKGASVMVWTTDLLPDALTGTVEPLMQAGIEAFARNLEAVA